MNLGLLGDASVRVEQMRHIVQLAFPANDMRPSDNVHAVTLGEALEQLTVLICKIRQIIDRQSMALRIPDRHQLRREKLRKEHEIGLEFLGGPDIMLGLSSEIIK